MSVAVATHAVVAPRVDRIQPAAARQPRQQSTPPALARRRHGRQRAAVLAMAGGTGTELWALDFDGVACDSVGESSLSAFKV